jgi:general secretion pathway protein I
MNRFFANTGHTRARSANAGFTLVEVMVALLVVGIALPALLSQIASQADGTAALRDRSYAQWVAQNQLETLRLSHALAEQRLQGKASGEVEMAGRTWYWQAESEETELPGMWRQTVTVGGERDEALVSLTGFLKEHSKKAAASGPGN